METVENTHPRGHGPELMWSGGYWDHHLPGQPNNGLTSAFIQVLFPPINFKRACRRARRHANQTVCACASMSVCVFALEVVSVLLGRMCAWLHKWRRTFPQSDRHAQTARGRERKYRSRQTSQPTRNYRRDLISRRTSYMTTLSVDLPTCEIGL